MPIRIELAPRERLYIGKGVLVNGASRTDFIMEGRQPLLRSKDYLAEEEIVDDVDRLYRCIQQMYLEESVDAFAPEYGRIQLLLSLTRPLDASTWTSVDELVNANQHYKALKKLKNAKGQMVGQPAIAS